MARTDLNLLHALDVLLTEGSVAQAAKRLQLSPSAMSRALARLRAVTGDQLLVRAGRGLVPTPRADELRLRVREAVEEAEALLRPTGQLNLSILERTFAIRASDGFAETFGAELIGTVRDEAPKVRLRFVRKLDKDSGGLRDGSLDLETGVVAPVVGPEVRTQALFVDRYVGVVRATHALAQGTVTARRYAEYPHVVTWRQGLDLGSVDDLLGESGYVRDVATMVDGFSAALALARETELVATVPERHTAGLRSGMHTFLLPVPARDFTISMFWHPRLDGDPAHRWLRDRFRDVCQQRTSGNGADS